MREKINQKMKSINRKELKDLIPKVTKKLF